MKSIQTTVYNLEAAGEKIAFLKAAGASFQHRKTSGTEKIVYSKNGKNYVYFYVENKVSEKFIETVGFLKTEIKKNFHKIKNSPFNFLDKRKQYFSFSETCYHLAQSVGEVFTFEKVYEADITAAYYQAALYLGLISEKTFEIVTNEKNISKPERLRLLGSIAGIRVESTYIEGILQEPVEVVKDTDLRQAWFTICNFVDGCMNNFIQILGSDFIFYWVDGIYFKGNYESEENNLEEIFLKLSRLEKHFPFKWKIKPLKSVEIQNKGYLELIVEKTDGEKKPFFIPTKKIKGFYLK